MGDGSYWIYQYDNLGQVISGNRFWGDGTPVAGQQFNYAFDDIGNRTSSKFGGDAAGQNLQPVSYTRNLLNQYSQRTVPGIASVLGIANPTATVTINSSSVYRKGEYFWKELSVANGGASVWQSLSVQAVNGINSTTVTGNEYVPKTPEVYSYDSDGNLTQDGRWNYTWDGENRLVRMVAATANGPQQRLDFSYDSMGRRIRKQVWNNTAGTNTASVDIKFLYDGWNLIAELDALNSNTNIRTYLWGTDVSGSGQGAGGVGGLLETKTSSGIAQFALFDGNGNLTRLVDGSAGTTSANYEYGPFGETIRASGTYAGSNPLRYSTKYIDTETDPIYYGYRFLKVAVGQWINRDPITEEGGVNLYGFLRNSPLEMIDALGRAYDEQVINVSRFDLYLYGGGQLVDAYTGDPDKKSKARPVINHSTQDEVKETGCGCAKVIRAEQIDVRVLTALPNDSVGVVFTQRGLGDVTEHEKKRRDAYHEAYKAYIDPVESFGERVTRCGYICRPTSGAAKRELLQYLDDNRQAGIQQFKAWTQTQMDAIGREGLDWFKIGGLKDHYLRPYTVPAPPPLKEIPCPPWP